MWWSQRRPPHASVSRTGIRHLTAVGRLRGLWEKLRPVAHTGAEEARVPVTVSSAALLKGGQMLAPHAARFAARTWNTWPRRLAREMANSRRTPSPSEPSDACRRGGFQLIAVTTEDATNAAVARFRGGIVGRERVEPTSRTGSGCSVPRVNRGRAGTTHRDLAPATAVQVADQRQETRHDEVRRLVQASDAADQLGDPCSHLPPYVAEAIRSLTPDRRAVQELVGAIARPVSLQLLKSWVSSPPPWLRDGSPQAWGIVGLALEAHESLEAAPTSP